MFIDRRPIEQLMRISIRSYQKLWIDNGHHIRCLKVVWNIPEIMRPLVEALVMGDKDRAVQEALLLLHDGVPMEKIVLEGIKKAMESMDSKCTMEDFNLLEIMLVGRAAMEVMKVIMPKGVPPPSSKGAIILATAEGDVHDLGKNIVRTILTANGYHVIDLGKDCSVASIVSSAVAERVNIIGVSGLITSVIPTVRSLRDSLKEGGIDPSTLLAGGAALSQASADELKVDYVAMDVFSGVRYLRSLDGD